jgi:hypothetical protein
MVIPLTGKWILINVLILTEIKYTRYPINLTRIQNYNRYYTHSKSVRCTFNFSPKTTQAESH